MNLHLFEVDKEYIKELNDIDKNVQTHHGNFKKSYTGIVLSVRGIDYFVPLSSPKKKYEKLIENATLIKIKHKDELKAVLNLNNMIPIPKFKYKMIDFKRIKNIPYRQLLAIQLNEIRLKEPIIKKKALELHEIMTKKRSGFKSSSIFVVTLTN